MRRPFRSGAGAAFSCGLDFGELDYVNLHFLDRDEWDILFHLSFRFDSQRVVFNRRIDGQWQAEQAMEASFPRTGARLEIAFGDGTVSATLDGTPLTAELPAPDPAGTGPGQGALHWVRADGDVSEVRLGGSALDALPAIGALLRPEPFRLEGWAYDPAEEDQRIVIEVGPDGTPLPHSAIRRPRLAQEHSLPTDRLGVIAPLPGWVWLRAAPGADSVDLKLTCNGRVCGDTITLTKAQVLGEIERLITESPTPEEARATNAPHDPYPHLVALEHVRFAALTEQLTAVARVRLSKTAKLMGVTSYLDTPIGLPSAAAARAEAEAEASARRDPVRAFLPSLDPNQPDEMVARLKAYPFDDLTEEQQRTFLFAIAGKFCRAERFEDLFAVARAIGHAQLPSDWGGWTLTLAMPFFYAAGNGPALLARMDTLTKFEGDWLDTAPLRWVMVRVLRERPDFLSESERETVIGRFLTFLRKSTPDYFRIGPHRALIETAVALLGDATSLPDHMRDWIDREMIDAYGLHPSFWEAVAAARADGRVLESVALTAAEQRFERLRTAVEDDTGRNDPTLTSGLFTPDAQKVQRELDAACRQPDGSDPLPAETTDPNSPEALDDALLRHLAFPVETEPRPDLARQTTQALRRSTGTVPKPTYGPAQQSAHALATDVLNTADAEIRADRLVELFRQLKLLCGPRSAWIGGAMGFALINAALAAGDTDLAAAARSQMASLLGSLDRGARGQIGTAPAVRMAVYGLHQRLMGRDDPDANDIRSLFPDTGNGLPPAFAPGDGRPRAAEGAMAAFHDTIVVVFSCVANLDTRIPALRDAWLETLAARGIPYIIVVGDGDGRRDGDVVHLDAPDSYEGLPHKTLAAVEWVYRNTPYAHMLKIDDDCFLDVDRFFSSQAYRKFAYYGRVLHRVIGQTDRVWHLPRSRSEAASMELDKSAEPSTYADGGSGYTLNRKIMEILLNLADSREGAWLKRVTFMEDKLVGDLLGLIGVLPDQEDYHCCILRRMHAGGLSVSKWATSFLPGPLTPVQMTHLDNADLQARAAEQVQSATLWPKRLWPTYKPVAMAWDDNNVELMSPLDKLHAVNAADIAVVGCLRDELPNLPQFLAHYRRLGVGGFLMIDNCSTDGTLESLAAEPDVAVFSAHTDYGRSAYGVAWQQAVLANLRMNRWSLIADCDELLMLPEGIATLPDLLASPDFDGADAARIFMLDMYPEGPLSEAEFTTGDPFETFTHVDAEPFLDRHDTGPFGNSGVWTSALRHRLLPGSRPELFVAQKIALLRHKPWMRMTAGVHFASDIRLAKRDLIFGHFKYHAAFRAKVEAEAARGQHFNDAEEYRRYAALMAEGREVLYDPAVSVRWQDCDWVRRTLA